MIRIAACEEKEREQDSDALNQFLQDKHHDCQIETFENTSSLAGTVEQGESYDLYLLDGLALEKLFEFRQLEGTRFFPLSTPEGICRVPFAAILMVELQQRRMCFHMADGTALCSRTVRVAFPVYASSLIADGRFLLVRKTCLVNMGMIDSFTSAGIVMQGGMTLRIPRKHVAGAKKQYREYLQAAGQGASVKQQRVSEQK